MTFCIHAQKDGRDASTIRADAPNALHVARKLADDGWTVSITSPDGKRYSPDRFFRVLVTLLHEMAKRDAKKGLATLCIGGGMGIAMCIARD